MKPASLVPALSFALLANHQILLFGQNLATPPPVLTVCEALRNLEAYNGRDIVIVGRAAFTFEGTVVSEHCESDGRIQVQAERWLSAMMVFAVGRPQAFQFDESRVREKLDRVKQSTRSRSDEHRNRKRNLFDDRWAAIFGRLVSPKALRPDRPPQGARTKNVPGNGFGANGSVPAKLEAYLEQEVKSEP